MNITTQVQVDHVLRFPGGESVYDMKSRVNEVLIEIKKQYEENNTILVVAHGGTLYHFLHHISDIFPATDAWFTNCSYNIVNRENYKAK